MNTSAIHPACLVLSSGLKRRSYQLCSRSLAGREPRHGLQQHHHLCTSPSVLLLHHGVSASSTSSPVAVLVRSVQGYRSCRNMTIPQRRQISSTPELTHQRIKGRRRFYKHVTIREKVRDNSNSNNEEGKHDRRWEVLLDSRVLKTPGRRSLEFDSSELAMAVAGEWDTQVTSKGIEPAVMPLMALASTAIDQVASDREKTISTCLKYLPTDTVCFLSPDPDPVVARRQRQLWAPLRDWAGEALGIPVATTTEIHRKPEHPPESLAQARNLLESLDEWGLAAVQSVTMECKSLVIALALLFRKTTVEKAFDAARLEEEYNVERWGMIEGGHDMDRGNTSLALTAASTLIWLRSTPLPKPSPWK
ncbi:unnamed protein product [Pylaiella littoralis]